ELCKYLTPHNAPDDTGHANYATAARKAKKPPIQAKGFLVVLSTTQ
ncbi:MAG: hypothetical protein ACI88C_001863, partial [Acidimicrobiales bacterium]